MCPIVLRIDYGRKLEERNGRYCVQFNYFRQTENGRRVLTWWKEKCMEWCFDIPEPDRMGDQKYLNGWPEKFPGVWELQHLGGGVAPWNLEQYRFCGAENGKLMMEDGSRERNSPWSFIISRTCVICRDAGSISSPRQKTRS